MTTAHTAAAPTQRLVGPDLARGVMLLLIAMAYAGSYAMAGFGVDVSGEPVLDRIAAFASTLLLDNRAFPMFAILFGYGLAWSIARRSERQVDPKDLKRGLRRRALMLLAFGAVHAVLIFPGEILTSYGVALLVTGWLLFRSEKALRLALWVTGVFYVLVVPLVAMGGALSEQAGSAVAIPGYTSVDDWVERTFGLPFAPLFVALGYPLLFLVVLGYSAGRARLFEKTVSKRPLLVGIAIGGVVVSVFGAYPAALTAIGVFDPEPAVTGLLQGLQILTGVAGGAGYAACFALSAGWFQRMLPRLTGAVTAVGKRSLTFYILNSVMIAVILHPELLGVGAQVGNFGAIMVAAATWLVGVLLAVGLERANRPGLLEVIMRRAIYRA